MKNKYFIIFFICFVFNNPSFAEQFIFETTKIDIIEQGNVINALDGKAISSDKNFEIEAKEFRYFKDLNILKAYNGIAFIKSDNLEIKFNEIELDQKKFILTAKNDIKIFDNKKNITILSNLVTYNWKFKVLNSDTHSIVKDQFNNVFDAKSFNYEISKNILKIVEANFKDYDNNSFYTKLAYINTLTNQLVGKDISIDLNNKSFKKDNEPRLKGRTINYDNLTTEISKGIFYNL
jgi:hypothetical protein